MRRFGLNLTYLRIFGTEVVEKSRDTRHAEGDMSSHEGTGCFHEAILGHRDH
jgi:hypothetical protein